MLSFIFKVEKEEDCERCPCFPCISSVEELGLQVREEQHQGNSKHRGNLAWTKPFIAEVSDFRENYILLLSSKLYESAKLLYYL